MAVPRVPSTQVTMRLMCSSTASQSQTLRRLWPTNVHISSTSSTCGRTGCGRLGGRFCAFFCQLGYGHARYACNPHDAPLRDAFHQQLLDLGIARRPRQSSGLKIALMAAVCVLVLGSPATAPIFAKLLARAAAADMTSRYHAPSTASPQIKPPPKIRYIMMS